MRTVVAYPKTLHPALSSATQAVTVLFCAGGGMLPSMFARYFAVKSPGALVPPCLCGT